MDSIAIPSSQQIKREEMCESSPSIKRDEKQESSPSIKRDEMQESSQPMEKEEKQESSPHIKDESSNVESNIEADGNMMSHKDLMDKVKSELAQLIKTDSLLNDLPGEITVEEVNSQIALEHGQAMTVFVVREDEEMMPIVVTQNATVQDLKQAIKRYFQLKLSREGTPRFISWRYIWKRYWLYYEGVNLSEDNKRIKDYGICNKDAVSFRKRLIKR